MSEAAAHTWESLVLGESASLQKLISKEDIAAFATLSGDKNPLHVEDGVVHGMYLGALVSNLVGMQLPGERALLMKESLSFKKPVHAGDTVCLTATLTHKSEATHVIELALTARVGERIVAEGEVLCQVRL